MEVSAIADLILRTLPFLSKEKFEKFKFYLSHKVLDGCPVIPDGDLDGKDYTGVVRLMEHFYENRMADIALVIFHKIDRNDLFNSLKSDLQNVRTICGGERTLGAGPSGTAGDVSLIKDQHALKDLFKRTFGSILEGQAVADNRTSFPQIYTELFITEGGSGGVNHEHEVKQTEMASTGKTPPETILCNDIFKPLPGQVKPRTVLTKGIAGIGKTVTVQKFILDWAEGEANEDIDFIFPLLFRDLNRDQKSPFSLLQLLCQYFPQVKRLNRIEDHEVNVVFILDGLDECRLPLNFSSNETCSDIKVKSSLDVLLTNLIKGNLLPNALLWITSRPAAANRIPPIECAYRVTEIRGFSDSQKVDYFKNKIKDQDQACRIISHIKTRRSLYIMCHIPVFCWISASVMGPMLDRAESWRLPKTLTEMYTRFLFIQAKRNDQKYRSNETTSASDAEIILKLGKLAFLHLQKDNSKFSEKDLSDIDLRHASVYSGVFTHIFKKECGLHQEFYCFVHLSVQEYLAALFAYHSFKIENINVLGAPSVMMRLSKILRSAVDQALKSENGHLDLFLRFLFGLSLESIQICLAELLNTGTPNTGILNRFRKWAENRSERKPREDIEEAVHHIKMKIKQEKSAERTINLFHCLNELNDYSLVKDIQLSLRSGKLSEKKLEAHECSAVAFVLLMSEEILDEFDLKTYKTSAAGRQRLVPVIMNCRKAILNSCDLTETSCNIVASALQSSVSPLRDLDLSSNNLGDSGVELLCAGLMSPNCKLLRLGLKNCDLTEKFYEIVASVLQSDSPLTDLDLSYNNLGDSGVELLCAGLMSPNCQLQRLGLKSCDLTERFCGIVALALQSLVLPLRVLDLSYNNLGDSGVRLLCTGLKTSNCTLQRLGLGWCNLTEGCCDDLASVLRSPHSDLRDLELRDNELQDSGVRALSAGLEDPHCKLQRLGLSGCCVTESGCHSLAAALCSNPSDQRELDLRYNHPEDSGVVITLSAELDTLKWIVDHGGENMTKAGPRKYSCHLSLDPNTVHRELSLSEGDKKVTHTLWGAEQPYPDHPERFESVPQVLCGESVSERCYWEAEYSVSEMGWVSVAVTCKEISRKGEGSDCGFGWNTNSWSLECEKRSYSDKHSFSVRHNKDQTLIPAPTSPYRKTEGLGGKCVYRVGVCVDRVASTLSFYSVSESNILTLLHRFHADITEHAPLCAGFGVQNSSVSLC